MADAGGAWADSGETGTRLETKNGGMERKEVEKVG